MAKVTIRVESGPVGFGPLAEVTVRAASVPEALAQALVSVTPGAGVGFAELIRLARLERARRDAGVARIAAANRDRDRGTADLYSLLGVPARAATAGGLPVVRALAGLVSGVARAVRLAGVSAPRVVPVVSPPEAGRCRLLVLPDEARAWNLDPERGDPPLMPGTREMPPSVAASFLAWRAGRAARARAASQDPAGREGLAGPT